MGRAPCSLLNSRYEALMVAMINVPICTGHAEDSVLLMVVVTAMVTYERWYAK